MTVHVKQAVLTFVKLSINVFFIVIGKRLLSSSNKSDIVLNTSKMQSDANDDDIQTSSKSSTIVMII